MLKYTHIVLFPVYVIIMLVLVVLSICLSPFLAGYSIWAKTNRLPRFWQKFSTLDADLDGGIWQGEYLYYLKDGNWSIWWHRMCWICRNPSNGWAYVLFKPTTPITQINWKWKFGDSEVYGTNASEFGTAVDARGKVYFTFKGKWWPRLFKRRLGLRYYFGWKLQRDRDEYYQLACALGIRRVKK